MRPAEKEFVAFVQEACKGNEDAVAFVVGITNVAHFFDDLYDGDVALKKTDTLNALWMTMVALPRNEFYRKFFMELQPLISNAITNWKVANEMEGAPTGETDLRVAFVVRSGYADLIQQVALICGGPDWATRVGVAARRLCHSEPWKDYLKSVEVSHGVVQRTESAGQQSGIDRVSPVQRADRPATDRHGQGAIRVVEAECVRGPADADAVSPTGTADR